MNKCPDMNKSSSRDYRKLVMLMKVHSVGCIVDHGHGCRHMAKTRVLFGRYLRIQSPGICYAYAVDEDDFIEQCESLNVEFFEPPTKA
jgi:hypothetical protein